MTNCCELALANAKLAQQIAWGAFATISLLLLMFFGYSLHLDKRTIKLEKKNGKEMKKIVELEKKLEKLKKNND